MKVPQRRESLRSGEITIGSNVYSSYSSVEDSCRDLLIYLDSMGYPKDFDTLSMQINFMKAKNYFEISAGVYLAGVQACLNKIL